MIEKDQIIFIEHILENIAKIEKFSKKLSKEKLAKDELKKYAIIRAIEVIGEAVKNLSPPFRDKYPEIPWKDIAGARDVIIHRYFGVDLEIVWNIIKKDLPELKAKLIKIKDSLK